MTSLPRESVGRTPTSADREARESILRRKSTIKNGDRVRINDRIRFQFDDELSKENNPVDSGESTAPGDFWENRYLYRPSMMTVRFSTASILGPLKTSAKS